MNRGLNRFSGPVQPAGLPWRGVHGYGTLAQRPPACPANAGMLYFDTGTRYQYRSNGSTWIALFRSNFPNPLAVIQDQKSNGTDAGTFTAGAWRTRTLNTIVFDSGVGVTLASNQFTLQAAATYLIWARAPSLQTNIHRIQLWDATNSAVITLGRNAFSSAAGNVQTDAFLFWRFTPTTTAAYEIQHQCSATSTVGFGFHSGYGTEIYTEVQIETELRF